MLHTEEAKRAFAPARFRRWFLAGSTASASFGMLAAMVAAATADVSMQVAGAAGIASASFLASSIAVARMRAWGIFLGVATSLVLFGGAMAASSTPGMTIALLLASAPGFLLQLLPVIVARNASEPRLRVADETPRLRVSDAVPSDVASADDLDFEVREPTARPAAARV
jgi:hypothetical protein